jgi:hypothetical protein
MSYVVNPVTLRPFSKETVSGGGEVRPDFHARVSTSGGPVTVLAPEPTTDGVAFAVEDIDGQAGTNPITVDGNGSNIDGAATEVLASDSVLAIFVYDESQWRRVLVPRLRDDEDREPIFRSGEQPSPLDDIPDGSAAGQEARWTGTGVEWLEAPIGDVGHRLTLTTGVPVTTSDVTGAGTIYLSQYRHDQLPLWNGTQWRAVSFSEISLALAGLTSGKNYDVFAYLNGSTPTLELSAAWTNDTTRADALARQTKGVLSKSGALTRRWMGTIRATGAASTEDSRSKRFLSNLYNAQERPTVVHDSTASWTYAVVNTWRQARATAANRFEILLCEPRLLEVDGVITAQLGSSSGSVYVGVGIDSTTANSAQLYSGVENAASNLLTAHCKLRSLFAEGYRAVNWLEWTNGGGTTTYFGGADQRGLLGRLLA